jgi:hypothetical protein
MWDKVELGVMWWEVNMEKVEKSMTSFPPTQKDSVNGIVPCLSPGSLEVGECQGFPGRSQQGVVLVLTDLSTRHSAREKWRASQIETYLWTKY